MKVSIDSIVNYLTDELNLDQNKAEIIRFGLQNLSYTIGSILTVFTTSLALGIWRESITIMLVIMFYRNLSGGAHCATPLRCITVGTVTILLLAYLTRTLSPLILVHSYIHFLFPLVALVITYLFAPAEVPEKPITSQRHRTILRTSSITFLLIWLFSATILPINRTTTHYLLAGNLGLLWQALLLTPLGFKLIHNIDNLLARQCRYM